MSKDMNADEAVRLMTLCRDEIRMLRRQIERLTPRAEAYDHLTVALTLLRQRMPASNGEGLDLAWELDQRIREIQSATAKSMVKKEGGDA